MQPTPTIKRFSALLFPSRKKQVVEGEKDSTSLKVTEIVERFFSRRDYKKWERQPSWHIAATLNCTLRENQIAQFRKFASQHRSLFFHHFALFMQLFYDKTSLKADDISIRYLSVTDKKELFNHWKGEKSTLLLNEVCHNPRLYKENPAAFIIHLAQKIDLSNRIHTLNQTSPTSIRDILEGSSFLHEDEKDSLKLLINLYSVALLERLLFVQGIMNQMMLRTYLMIGSRLKISPTESYRESKNLHPDVGHYGFRLHEGNIIINTTDFAKGTFKQATDTTFLGSPLDLIRLSTHEKYVKDFESEINLIQELHQDTLPAEHLIPPPLLTLKSKGKKDLLILESWSLKLPYSGKNLIDAPLYQKAKAMSDFCFGVASLHLRNLSHNDVKPENTMSADDPLGYPFCSWKVGDLGLTTSCESKRPEGAPYYAHPGIKGNDRALAIFDMWSLGITGFDLVYGKRNTFNSLRRSLKAFERQDQIDFHLNQYYNSHPLSDKEAGLRYFQLCHRLVQLECKESLIDLAEQFLTLALDTRPPQTQPADTQPFNR